MNPIRRVTLVGTPILMCGASLLFAAPAAADLSTDLAQCQGQVVITGDEGTLVNVNQDTDKFTVDPSGSYVGVGSVFGGGKGKARSYTGAVVIDLPAPFPDYGPGSWGWSGTSKTYSSENPKVGDYSVPDWVPRGFYVPLVATHTDDGKLVCVYEGQIKLIGGGLLSSPIGIGSLVLAIVTGLATLLAGVPKKVI
jgi:hypothetical protein